MNTGPAYSLLPALTCICSEACRDVSRIYKMKAKIRCEVRHRRCRDRNAKSVEGDGETVFPSLTHYGVWVL